MIGTEEDEQQQQLILTEIIPTTSGKLQGFQDQENAVEVFLGIPYAEPPIDALRYKPTVPLYTPHHERMCIQHAPAAPQTAMPFDTLMCVQIDHQSEDCLYLNIWTPIHKESKRPVIVWFHPGACMSGSSSQPFWDGTNLAKNDTIIVSFNYRLGALGWMAMDHISTDLKGTANLGLLDQITALKWVQENIGQFGGDPNNVTAFGSSAGATCIMSIILSPNTSGLFQKIVLQSPPMFLVSPQDWAEMKGDIFIRSLGLDDKSTLLSDLQSIDVETFLDSQTFMTTWPNFLEGLAPIGPSTDNDILPSTIIQHFFHYPLPPGYENIEIVIGYTRDEFNFFFPFLPNFQEMDDSMFVRTYFTHIFGIKHAKRAYELYKEEIVPPQSPPSEVTRYMCSDVMCRIATLLTAENLASHGHKVWLYEWDYESNDVQNVIKAAHMVDSVFSWDNLIYWTDNPFLGPGDDYERDRIAKQISLAIIQFAKSGNPNHDGIPEWPLYITTQNATAVTRERHALIFDREVRVEQNIYEMGLQLWKTVLKDYIKTPMFPVNPVAMMVASSSSKEGPEDNKKRKVVHQE